MDSRTTETKNQPEESTDDAGTTRRAVLAAGGAVALSGLAGCSALDGLLDSASEQVIGTTASAPAAFYPGRESGRASNSVRIISHSDSDSSNTTVSRPQLLRSGEATVSEVPVSITHQGRLTELEGWSISTSVKANDYNSVRSNKRRSEWWGGPDDENDDDGEGDGLVDILDIELELLRAVTAGRHAVNRGSQSRATAALDGFINTTTEALWPALDSCRVGVCETVRATSDGRKKTVEQATDAVRAAEWENADGLLQEVEEIVLGDIERLDDEIVERRPERPRFIDIIRYLRDEPTIGERFTVSLPDASLPGDRGSLAEELTPERLLAYFAVADEPDGKRAPFHDQYGSTGVSYDEDGCVSLDGPVSMHSDVSCGSILSAALDTYRTANRAITGYSTEDGAVVSGVGRNPQTGKEIQIPAEAVDTDGSCVFVAPDGTLREAASLNDEGIQCWGRERSATDGELYCWGSSRSAGEGSVSETLVCPVSVTPADCPCPLPGLFYVQRIVHDNQLLYAGGWLLDEGALFEESATLLVAEGPTEIASVTSDDVDGDEFDERVRGQFSRDRSQQGSAVLSGRFGTDSAGIPTALQTEEGRRGLNAVNVKVAGEAGNDGEQIYTSVTALDAPLVHLANAAETDSNVKFKAGAELSKSVN